MAQSIAEVIEKPGADVYTLPAFKAQVVGYYAAEDLGAAEQGPPFVRI